MKTYYLIDKKDNSIVSKFEIKNDFFEGVAFDCVGWDGETNEPLEWQFHSEVYAKWDGCSHWWFKGEDYNESLGKCNNDGVDSYYHICSSFEQFIRTMCFVWKLADIYHLKRNNNDMTKEEYELPIIEYMLKDYKIVGDTNVKN